MKSKVLNKQQTHCDSLLEMKYSRLLSLNKELKQKVSDSREYNIVVLSNIVPNYIKEILECSLRKNSINADVAIGDYDNILQDSEKYSNLDCQIIFWEAGNIIDGLHYKIELMDEPEVSLLLDKTKKEITFAFNSLGSSKLVLFNSFSSTAFSGSNLKEDKLEKFAGELNRYVCDNLPLNFVFVNIEKVIAQASISSSFDFRFYYSSKSLYSVEFYKHYVEHIKSAIMPIHGKAKKAMIFDCDNTLWKGVIGEDGFDGINMQADDNEGRVFAEVQSIARSLAHKGIIIGLCSKNNTEDIEEVLNTHPDMILGSEDIAVKMVNWNDKVNNLMEIASYLNIGIDSIVYVDDSDYEIEAVKHFLPEVTTLKVPKRLYDYPKMIRESLKFFYKQYSTKEDKKRLKLYKDMGEREKAKDNYTDIESYLESLGLVIKVYCDARDQISRISQLTNKTNQFNLTTKRYTLSEIESCMKSDNQRVFSLEAQDRFGNYGLTGVCIVKEDNLKGVSFDTLLLSCRILGRKIEFKFIDYIISLLKNEGREVFSALYLKTPKNNQVIDFWDKVCFDVVRDDEESKHYKMHFDDYKSMDVEFINQEM